MTHQWGHDTWGSGVWGGHANYAAIMQAEWPFDSTRPSDTDALYDLFRAIHQEYGYYELILDVLKRQRRLQTATGTELEKLATEVGVKRESGERDERLRFRTLISKATTRSLGTIEDFATLLNVLFGDDVSKMKLASSIDEPVVEVHIPSVIIDAQPVTASELESLLTTVLPASDDVVIVTDETWLLGESGSQGIGEGELL